MSLKKQLKENTDELVRYIENFPNEYFNSKPNPNSWSAAEVLEHIYRSEFVIPRMFRSDTETLSDRKPDFKLQEMNDYMNSPEKFKSPEALHPKGGEKNKEELISKYKSNRRAIGELIEEYNLEELCLLYEHPLFGTLTRLEWIHFCIIHTKRHLRQIIRINNALGT